MIWTIYLMNYWKQPREKSADVRRKLTYVLHMDCC
jgi:hypothetical protein